MLKLSPLIALLSLVGSSTANSQKHNDRPQHLHKRQTDFSYGACYIANDIREVAQIISKSSMPETIPCVPVDTFSSPSSSPSVLSTMTMLTTLALETTSPQSSSTPVAVEYSSSSQDVSSSTADATPVSSSIASPTTSPSFMNSTIMDMNYTTSYTTLAPQPTNVNNSMNSTTTNSTATPAVILTPILLPILGVIEVSLASNGTAIGNISACPQEVSGAQYYYYYTTDSAEAIQFSLAPTGFNSTTPTTIQFNSEVVISYTYFGIEDSNYATPGQSGSEFSSNGGGSGSLAAITEGNGQDMFDSSDSYDGASMSSQASIWTYDENFVLGAQFWNFNTSSTDGAANNVSIILFEANYDLGQGYSFIAVQGDGEMVEGNGVEVYLTFLPM